MRQEQKIEKKKNCATGSLLTGKSGNTICAGKKRNGNFHKKKKKENFTLQT